jgi:cytochrome c oxidase subunit III
MAPETNILAETTTLAEYKFKEGNNRLGLWLFIISDAFVFIGLLVARFNLLGFDYHPDVNQIIGIVITSMLLFSSYFMFRAETMMAYGDTRGFVRNSLVTMILGAIFLVGVVGVEWQMAPAGPDGGAAWSLFYAMTGFHAFHVFTGLLLLFIVWRKARLGKYSAERHWGVEAAAVYWHFVDVVWFFFYVALYLIGKPII